MRAMLDADAGTAPYSVHFAPIVKPGLTIMHPRVRSALSFELFSFPINAEIAKSCSSTMT